MNDLIIAKEFSIYLKKIGKRSITINSYECDVLQFLDYIHGHNTSLVQVDLSVLGAYKEVLEHTLHRTSNTVRRAIIGIKQFLKFSYQAGYLHSDYFSKIVIPPYTAQIPSLSSQNEMAGLLEIAEKDPSPIKAARDVAILTLLCYEGIKASELITLHWSDFLKDECTGTLRIAGERLRILHLDGQTFKALERYQRIHATLKLESQRLMFIGFKGHDTLTPQPQLTRHGLKFMLYELGSKAKVPSLNSEKLRHFAIVKALEQGLSPDDIKEKLGLKQLGKIQFFVKHTPQIGCIESIHGH